MADKPPVPRSARPFPPEKKQAEVRMRGPDGPANMLSVLAQLSGYLTMTVPDVGATGDAKCLREGAVTNTYGLEIRPTKQLA
jgi:hypothetical protein